MSELSSGDEYLSAIEQAVLDRLLDRKGEAFAVLRQQAGVARATSRRFTGVGFFTSLAVARDAPRLAPSAGIDPIRGVGADIAGLRHGAGFVLFVADGAIKTLEGFTDGEPWPDLSDDFTVFSTG